MKKIFWIVGEKSGDNIASDIVTQLQELGKFQMLGLLGESLEKKCKIKSIFPVEDISVMGVSDVLKSLPKILSRINLTAKSILQSEPNIVVSIDSYDFCIRVAKAVKAVNRNIKFLHIVAPSVWAYKKSRAKEIANFYNILLCFLPFEKKFFTNLECHFIGNPVINRTIKEFNFSQTSNFDLEECRNKNQIAITLGSRIGEVNRHLPIICKTIKILLSQRKKLYFVIIATAQTKEIIKKYMKENLQSHYSSINITQEKDIIKKSIFAIAKSGTNALEFSVIKIPIVVYYKASVLTYIIAKLLLKIKYISLINIIMKKGIITEIIQPNAGDLAKKTIEYLNSKSQRLKQVELADVAIKKMYKDNPCYIAAKLICENL
jgi:lipid-A-disaccharide synthase